MFLEREACLMDHQRRQRLARMKGKERDLETVYGRSQLHPVTAKAPRRFNLLKRIPRIRIHVSLERRERPTHNGVKALRHS